MASPHTGGDRQRTLAPVLGALGVVAVAIVAILVFGSGHDSGNPTGSEGTAVASDRALACPRDYTQTRGDTDGWVPNKPQGLNGDDQLVPEDTPTHAVVCAYLDGADPNVSKSVPLTGRSVLKGSLAGLVKTLSDQRRISTTNNVACATVLTRDDTHNYVIGLSYGKAVLWVSAPGYHCAGSTNGSFTTRTNLSSDAAASYEAKKWVTQR